MKKDYLFLFMLFLLSGFVSNISAQFVVAQDTINGRIDFCSRLGDFSNKKIVSNDSVFYMLPPTPATDPWRNVLYYLPSRQTVNGYIDGTRLMRVDDYDMVEVERFSAHGSISFKNQDIYVVVSVTSVNTNSGIKQDAHGGFIINGKQAVGTSKWHTPKHRYQSISVKIKGKIITFPRKVYEHLLNPEMDNMAVYHDSRKDIVYIVANNGDADARYQVLWQVSQRGVTNPYIFFF